VTLAQASCLADVLNGVLIQPGISLRPGMVHAEASDVFQIARDRPIPDESSYGTKWGIDEQLGKRVLNRPRVHRRLWSAPGLVESGSWICCLSRAGSLGFSFLWNAASNSAGGT
jgi:hypothetical protein